MADKKFPGLSVMPDPKRETEPREVSKGRMTAKVTPVGKGKNEGAVRNFLKGGTDVSGQFEDYIPEGGSGGDYLKIMARDATNDARSDYNQRVVGQQQEQDAMRQAQVQNALQQEAAQQRMAIQAQEAAQQEQFFRTTGIVPSPQAMAEFAKQRNRQETTSQLVKTLSKLSELKDAAMAPFIGQFKGADPEMIPGPIRAKIAEIEAQFAKRENQILMASGLMSGLSNPQNMIPKDQNPY